MIFPVQRALVESVEPEIRPIGDDKRTEEAYRAWADSRNQLQQEPHRQGLSGAAAEVAKGLRPRNCAKLGQGTARPSHEGPG